MTDHLDEGLPLCNDPKHIEAVRLRRSGSAEWFKIDRGQDGGGDRDFLDGRPIHCGASLQLQALEYHHDDYGEYTLRQNTGIAVRYELAWPTTYVAGAERRRQIVLHVGVGGHEFTSGLQPWMRFRWPERGQ